jgi:hypothetical protein
MLCNWEFQTPETNALGPLKPNLSSKISRFSFFALFFSVFEYILVSVWQTLNSPSIPLTPLTVIMLHRATPTLTKKPYAWDYLNVGF